MTKKLLIVCCVVAGLACGVVQADEPMTGTAHDAEVASQVVAYYFFTDFRCATCKKLEAYSEEAINQGFPDQLAAGELAFKAVNTDKKPNRHFVEDFELITKSLVLVEYHDGKVVRFKNLKLIWQLVGDKEGFLTYVRDQTRDFLEAA